MTQLEKIESYLLDRMTEEERRAFQEAMAQDAGLKNEVYLHQQVAEGIEHAANKELKAELRQIHREVTGKPGGGARRWLWLVAFLLLAALLAYLLWPAKSQDAELLFAQFYEVYEPGFGTRTANGDALLAEAADAYYKKNYLESISLLEQALDAQPDNAELKLSLGNAYLATAKSQQAADLFRALVEEGNPLFQDHARWYLALALLRQERIQESTAILNALQADPGADHHEAAAKLLQELRK